MGNYNFDDLQYLQIPLPEELLKLKWHGSFTRMKRIIDAKLANDIPIALKKRLLHEKEIIRRIIFILHIKIFNLINIFFKIDSSLWMTSVI